MTKLEKSLLNKSKEFNDIIDKDFAYQQKCYDDRAEEYNITSLNLFEEVDGNYVKFTTVGSAGMDIKTQKFQLDAGGGNLRLTSTQSSMSLADDKVLLYTPISPITPLFGLPVLDCAPIYSIWKLDFQIFSDR